MSEKDRISRAKRDFITNPYFEVMLGLLQEVAEKEMVSMRAAAREGDLGKIQYHTGIVDGVERAVLRMDNEREPESNG
jgi:hypothetical protein